MWHRAARRDPNERRSCMRIAQVAPMYEAVPPQRYGGTERVVSYLTEELVRRGHDVTLFASGDSRTRARLVPTSERSLRQQFTLQEMQELAIPLHQAMLSEVLQHAAEFDIIHCHNDYWVFPFEPFVPTPVVTTLHGRLDLRYLPPIFERFPRSNVISISYHQRAPLASVHPHWVGMVYNAVPVAEFPFSETPGDYFVFLGRIAPEKRVDWAIEIAKRTGIKLKIAAKVDVYDREYFEREIKHLLDHPLIEFLGEVDEQEKRALLAGAYALVFPIDWPEPFGMVMIEAMACGTPVLAMSRGSVPEVLRHGVSGLVGNSVDELVALAPQLGLLSRRACRIEAERRFSTRAMAGSYEQIYHRVIAERQSEELARALGAGKQRVPTPVKGI
jgi:glycosyltransferase involved in cell wall biosynthesis